jgi:D-amino-acid dehydrogenase
MAGYDVAIIGGGLLGWAAAYRLTRAGQRPIVIDASDVGTATMAGAGIISPGTSVRLSEPMLRLGAGAVAYYPELMAELAEDGETDTGYETCGGLFVAHDEEEAARLPEIAALFVERRDAGMGNIGEVRQLDGAEAREIFPALSDLPGAVLTSAGARVDGRRLRAALRSASERRGATLLTGRATLALEGTRATGVIVDGQHIPAGQALICGGAWSPAVAQALGLDLPIRPQRGQILHVDVPDRTTSAWPFVAGFHSHYLLAFPERRVVAGATREHGTGFDPRLTAGGVAEVLAAAFRTADGLRDATFVEMRVGLRPFSMDEMPVLGQAPGWDNIFLSTGHGPSGLQLGPYSSARVVAQMLGAGPTADIAPLGPARFVHQG